MSSGLEDPRTAPSSIATYDRRRHRRAAPGPDHPETAPESPAAREWTAAQRVAFRFVCAYFTLYLAPFPLDQIPLLKRVAGWYGTAWEHFIVWSGAHVLHLAAPIVIVPTGSGDTMADFVRQLWMLVAAVVVAALWSAVDRRRREYATAHDWLRVYVRYGLAFILLGYGAIKVIKSQFPGPGLERLVEPYGQFSPMGVLWSFMGASLAYNVFTGLGECVGAALLFWRRTTTVGALLLVVVMANVVILNFAYDVPVKLFSTNLLLMAVFLAAADARRLARVLVLNRAVMPADLGRFGVGRWGGARLRALRVIVKALAVVAAIVLPFREAWRGNHEYGDNAPCPPLYGIYDVERFVAGHDTLAPLLTDSVRWRRLIFSRPGFVSAQMMSDSVRRFSLVADTTKHTLHLASRDSTVRYTFRYDRVGDVLRMAGTRGGDSVRLVLRRVDHTKSQLLGRGFHWVQQFPFNR